MIPNSDMSVSKRASLTPTAEDAVPVDALDQLRADTYRFLAALLAAPPGPELLGSLQTGLKEEQSEANDGPLAAAWQMLRLAARETDVARLDDEYHDLFIGLGRGELVPYGSWYLTGFLMDRPLAYLRQDLRYLGIVRQEGVSEPEDHVAALCEAMVEIIQAEADIAPQWQRKFFSDHLAPWINLFFQDLQKAKCACFYANVGRLGEAFMNLELQYLEART